MSSSALGGASHMIPNQANGYSLKYGVCPSTWARVIDREPSAPTRTSHRISCRVPAASV
jgi:hypothetical protein